SLFRSMELYIYISLFEDLSISTQSGLVAKFIKKNGLDWQLKFALLKIKSIFSKKTDHQPDEFDCIALCDVMNFATISCVNSVGLELAAQQIKFIYIYADNRLSKRSCSNYTSNYAELYGIFDEFEANALWGKYKNSFVETLRTINADINFLNSELDIKLLSRIAKQTIREIIALDNFYLKYSPKLVFMGSDSHKLARITSLLGKTRKFKTLVIQHGAPILPHAYVPLFADWIAIWSEGIRQWFIRNGVSTDKLVVTGNPRYDKFKFQCNNNQNNKNHKKKIVLLTNPLGAEINYTILNLLLPALVSAKLDFVIKPHPSEPAINYDFYFNELNNVNCTIERNKAIEQLININDIVITVNSTAGIEALMLGGIIHIVNITGIPNSIPYSEFDIANDIFTSDDATIKIGNSIINSDGYSNKVAVFLKWYAGELDGNSSKRICNFIKEVLN
ncbi:MAG: hypothetical protein PHW82_16820, partial [Bacteroidales bacterium]|nr:hypothetical protein [Bacteroidales bacterium]